MVSAGRRLIATVWSHPANRSRPLTAVARLLGWQLRKRLSARPVVRDFHGLRFECAPQSRAASSVIYFRGLPDYHEMRFLQRYLRAGDNFVDVGANVGTYTLLAASIVRGGRIDAFEPAPGPSLRRNLTLNGLANVVVHEVALSDRVGSQSFALTTTSELAHLLPDGEGNTTVPCTTLDNALPPLSYAMAKVDVEGAEPLVLRGASCHLAALDPAVWQLELDGYSKRFGVDTGEIASWLSARGFDLFVYDADIATLAPVVYPGQAGRTNALAIARERLPEVAARVEARVLSP